MNTTDRYCRLARDGQSATLFLVGTWQLAHLGPIDAALAAEDLPASHVTLDGAALDTLDTAATLALLRRMVAAGATIEQLANFKETHVVRTRMAGCMSLGKVPASTAQSPFCSTRNRRGSKTWQRDRPSAKFRTYWDRRLGAAHR